jgi:hypothetical protein
MPRGGARPGAGAKPKPPEQLRVRVEVRLPPAAAEALRRLQLLSGDSQANIVAAALEAYEAACTRPRRKRKHAVVA